MGVGWGSVSRKSQNSFRMQLKSRGICIGMEFGRMLIVECRNSAHFV